MLSEWSRIRDQWEKARIADREFVSQSEVMSAHYGALAREIVRRDFRQVWRWLPASDLPCQS
jgi:hypothetical protein